MTQIPTFVNAPKYFGGELGRWLSLDFETTNIEHGSALNPENKLLLACWEVWDNDKLICVSHKWGGELEQSELLADIATVDYIVAHNVKFELGWLYRCGLDLHSVHPVCTSINEWVLHSNKRVPLDLDSVAARYGLGEKEHVVKSLIGAGVPPDSIPRAWLLEYCKLDTHLASKIWIRQFEDLYESDRLHLSHLRGLCTAPLASIEKEGMALEKEKVRAAYDNARHAAASAQNRLQQHAGNVNFNSPRQVADLLFAADKLAFSIPTDGSGRELRTASGTPSVSQEAILALRATTPQQRDFLEAFKEHAINSAALSKNLDLFMGLCEERDGILYAELNQTRTATGRLSSTGRRVYIKQFDEMKGAQIQNIDRDYKKLFKAKREGFLIGECDGAQIEFRVAADLSNDPIAKKEIAEWSDIHRNTAQALVSAGFFSLKEKPLKAWRQDAKPFTFKPLYGGSGSRGSAVRAYCEFFRKKYVSITREQEHWVKEVANTKQLSTRYGMIFYWPDAKADSHGYVNYKTQIYNYPVQGLATGEIVPIALVYFWHRIKDKLIYLINTVHDSLIAEVHPSAVDEFQQIAIQAMTVDVFNHLMDTYGYDFDTPLGTEIKVSTYWGDTDKSVKVNVTKDGKIDYFDKENTSLCKLLHLAMPEKSAA